MDVNVACPVRLKADTTTALTTKRAKNAKTAKATQ